MRPSNTEIRTLLDTFQSAKASRKDALLNYKRDGEWHSISVEELERKVRETTLGLYALGVRAGDRVGLLSENRPEWTIADLATLSSGAADVPIYPTQAPRQVAFILENAGIEVLFISDQSQYDRMRAELARASRLRVIIAFDEWADHGGPGDSDARLMTLEEVAERGRSLEAAEPQLYDTLRSSVTPDTLATIIYTSGTTGEPKGVMLRHDNIVSNVISAIEILPVDSSSVVLSFLPLSHIFERATFYLYLQCQATIYYCENFGAVAEYLRDVKPHYLTSVPRLFEKIYSKAMETAEDHSAIKAAIARWSVDVARQWAELESRGREISPWLAISHSLASRLVFAKWRAAVGGRIRYFVSGGAPLSADLARVFYGAGLPILQGYGLTESSPVITANSPEHNRLGSAGRPIPGVEVRIAKDGEILCSGPNVMQGYYNKPVETAEALEGDAEGRVWLHTGDIGHFDEDGFLYITDRKKDLLKTSGGKYIAPQPIENAIKQSRFVNQVVVIGDERKFPAALIVPRMDQLISYAKLKGISYSQPTELLENPRIIDLFERQVERYTQELAQYEKIKAVALIANEMTVESGELTPTLKVRRRVVTEKYKELIERLYTGKSPDYVRT
jgi:long-chain acyl-CoA synthetase